MSIIHAPRPSLTLPQHSKTLALAAHQPHRIIQKLPFIFNSYPISYTYRPSFKSSLSPQDSTPETSDEDETFPDVKIPDSDEDQKSSTSMKSLLNVYKEAILEGDEKTTAEVEEIICVVENEKNELIEKVSSLSAEIGSGKEKYIRLQADFDNFRKRSDKEKLTVRSNAQGEVIETLLPMVDNFERAKQQLKLETEQEKRIDASYQGIYKQFVEIMRNLHVAVVATVGKPFDPSLHEAIAREESEEFEEGIILQEFRRGFLLGERLLRPAMVKVSAGSSKKNPSAGTQEITEQPVAAAVVDEQ